MEKKKTKQKKLIIGSHTINAIKGRTKQSSFFRSSDDIDATVFVKSPNLLPYFKNGIS